MTDIIQSYRDCSFGHPEIDFAQIINNESNPFSNVIDQDQVNLGFGSSNSDITLDMANKYKNSFSFNFGSKKASVSKFEKEYKYEEIFERGSAVINENSSIDIRPKNNLITSPTFLCSIESGNADRNISLDIEKSRFNVFRVSNTSNRRIRISYIFSQTNLKILNISENNTDVTRVNNIINRTLS